MHAFTHRYLEGDRQQAAYPTCCVCVSAGMRVGVGAFACVITVRCATGVLHADTAGLIVRQQHVLLSAMIEQRVKIVLIIYTFI